VAAEYVETVSQSPVLVAAREAARAALVTRVEPGAHVLELGCGPGIDCVWLARQRFRVTAVDASPAMVAAASAAVAAAGVGPLVDVREAAIERIDRLGLPPVDAVYSSLGPLNCVADLDEVLARIGSCLRPGGVVVTTVMGRCVPWEIVWFGLRGDWRRATLRLQRGPVSVAVGGVGVPVRYFQPRAVVAAARRAGLTGSGIRGIGIVAPPPSVTRSLRGHPRWLRALIDLDARLGALPVLRACGDHLLIVLRADGRSRVRLQPD
jgi:SAM-dependent methyltransferase